MVIAAEVRTESSVALYWLPLGAGGSGCVRWNGRLFEIAQARREHRRPQQLYHAALEVYLDAARYVIEMGPVWSHRDPRRGVVFEGPVGSTWLGHSRWFRYEVRCWSDGVIDDIAYAVGGPCVVSTDRDQVQRLLDLVAAAPRHTWGRDEAGAGDMWNSNSLVAWLLGRSGVALDGLGPPPGGRAPGWRAGVVCAA